MDVDRNVHTVIRTYSEHVKISIHRSRLGIDSLLCSIRDLLLVELQFDMEIYPRLQIYPRKDKDNGNKHSTTLQIGGLDDVLESTV